MSYKRITVFGGGNAAMGVAACMSLMGCEVTLADFPEFATSLEPVQEERHIDLIRQDGPFQGKAEIAHVTTDIRAAIAGADAVLVCAQAHAHGRLAREIAHDLVDGQRIYLLPGSCFGSWEFRRNLESVGCSAEVVVAESNTLVFAARRTEVPNQVRIKHWATEVFVAALPAKDTDLALVELQEYFPQCRAAKDTLETCLLNLNPYVHSAPAILSISAVERSGGEFYHYVDGITPSTAKAMIALDNERIEVCRQLGYSESSVAEIFYRAGYMGQLTGDWVSDMQSTPVLREAKGPFSVSYRYYTEDTGVGLTVIYELGRNLGLLMSTHHALIHLCGVVNDTDFFSSCSRVPSRLGINTESIDVLREQFGGAA